MKKTIALLLPLIFLLATSCSFKELEFVGLTRLESAKMGLTESVVDLTFKVNNPNWYGFQLHNSHFEVEVAGSTFDLIGDEKWKIKPGDNYLKAQVKFNPMLNIGAVTKLLMSKTDLKNLTVKVKGDTQAKKFLISKTIVINETIPMKD
jgi:hypothetical protein